LLDHSNQYSTTDESQLLRFASSSIRLILAHHLTETGWVLLHGLDRIVESPRFLFTLFNNNNTADLCNLFYSAVEQAFTCREPSFESFSQGFVIDSFLFPPPANDGQPRPNCLSVKVTGGTRIHCPTFFKVVGVCFHFRDCFHDLLSLHKVNSLYLLHQLFHCAVIQTFAVREYLLELE
jgi:hypothetical protein